jgi:hypothetical protein
MGSPVEGDSAVQATPGITGTNTHMRGTGVLGKAPATAGLLGQGIGVEGYGTRGVYGVSPSWCGVHGVLGDGAGNLGGARPA